ncbi:MAG: cytosine permease [Pseudonocardia sp.]|nr:cytosine permease [Pseudonocardia sp.]
MSTSPSENALAVEQRGIEHIDEQQRHGNPRNQFSIRFSPVIYLAPIVVGGTAIPMGLGLTGSITAIVLGNLLGAICTGVCAAMGPRLGMPQLTMGRAAFGYHGNYLPAILSLLLYIGYFTVGTILGAQSIAELVGAPYVPVVVIVAAVSTLIAVYGYDLLHLLGRWITWISFVVLAAVTVATFAHGTGSGAASTLSGANYWLAWLVEFTVVFGYTMSWAPYASDYSRYLPVTTSQLKTFGWCTGGLFAATTWMMVLGAVVLTVTPHGETLDAFGIVLPGPLLKIALVLFGVSALPHNAVNIYSNAMTSLTWGLPLRRSLAVIAGGLIGFVLALLFGGPNFVTNFEAFLFLVTYYVTPWLAVLVIDFYWLRKRGRGYGSIENFYKPQGPFKGINWAGFLAFIVGLAVSVPFMATNLYTGPIGHALGGADLSYFVSFVVASVLYALLARRNATVDRNADLVHRHAETDRDGS